MKNVNVVEEIKIKELKDEEIMRFLECGYIDIYQREGDRVWLNNFYYPQDSDYYLFGEYHSFDISELKDYEDSYEIFNDIKLYQYEKSKDEILKLVKDTIEGNDYIYIINNFSNELDDFLERGDEYAIYAML